MTSPWVEAVGTALLDAYRKEIPDDVLGRAAIQLFDTIACAAGGQGAPVVEAVRSATRGSGPAEATVLFSSERISCLDAVLVNGTAVRYLDVNDAFIGDGPGGHPSDNIAVALAVGEVAGATGRDVLAATILGYELYRRLRRLAYAPQASPGAWDGVSASGGVAAAVAGLLLGLDEERFVHALALGFTKGYTLKQVRRGSISTVKACANALVARDGVLAARLAAEGVTGPLTILEGGHGLLAAFGLDATPELLAELSAPPTWAIRDISIKPYPAVATSQAAIAATLQIVHEHRPDPDDVVEVQIRQPDSKATREHIGEGYRQRPNSRESADHSIPFLIACAIEDAELSPAQFEDERWLRPSTTDLMTRVRVVPDVDLAVRARGAVCYPAIVRLVLADGTAHEVAVLDTPGSPQAPWGFDDVAGKFHRIDQLGASPEQVAVVRDALRDLASAPDLTEVFRAAAALGSRPGSAVPA